MKKYKGYEVQIQLIKENKPAYKTSIDASRCAYDLVKDDVSLFDREKFLTIYLDRKNNIMGVNESGSGSLSGSAVYTREVYKGAILSQASAVIFVHNHPSGDPTPSPSDRKLTKDLIEAGKMLNVQILDHIIIGDSGYYSFGDKGIISSIYKELKGGLNA